MDLSLKRHSRFDLFDGHLHDGGSLIRLNNEFVLEHIGLIALVLLTVGPVSQNSSTEKEFTVHIYTGLASVKSVGHALDQVET